MTSVNPPDKKPIIVNENKIDLLITTISIWFIPFRNLQIWKCDMVWRYPLEHKSIKSVLIKVWYQQNMSYIKKTSFLLFFLLKNIKRQMWCSVVLSDLISKCPRHHLFWRIHCLPLFTYFVLLLAFTFWLG